MPILPAAQLVLALAALPQTAPASCRFHDVVAAPNLAPPFLRPESVKPADLSGLLFSVKDREIVVWVRVSERGEVTDVCTAEPLDPFIERVLRESQFPDRERRT